MSDRGGADASVGRVVAHAEGAVSGRIFMALRGVEVSGEGAFGQRAAAESSEDVRALVAGAGRAAEAGERVAIAATASELAAARRELGHLAARGVGVVVHASTGAGEGGVELAAALSLGDLPLGILVAASAVEAVDLSLVARRAAEDSGCVFVVVHDWSGPAPELPALSAELCGSFLGGAKPEPAQAGAEARPLAERLPFALGSALRDLEGRIARRLDLFERAPAVDASLALVGIGAVGRAMVGDVARLRAAGHDVAGVRLVAWRPLAGPRLVKALYRAHAITVLEGVPRSMSVPPLASALKAAFADAITWAPGYPGIGRIPRVASGLVGGTKLGLGELEAIVGNMTAEERGARAFTLDGGRVVGHGAD